MIISIGKRKHKTRVIKDSHEPLWKEKFTFGNILTGREELVLSVYDDDEDGQQGDHLGSFKVGIEEIARFQKRYADIWVKLHSETGPKLADSGELRLKIQYLPPHSVEQMGRGHGDGEDDYEGVDGGDHARADELHEDRSGKGQRSRSKSRHNDDVEDDQDGGGGGGGFWWFGCCSSRKKDAVVPKGKRPKSRPHDPSGGFK